MRGREREGEFGLIDRKQKTRESKQVMNGRAVLHTTCVLTQTHVHCSGTAL